MAVTKHPKTIAYLGMSLDGYIADTAEGMTCWKKSKVKETMAMVLFMTVFPV